MISYDGPRRQLLFREARKKKHALFRVTTGDIFFFATMMIPSQLAPAASFWFQSLCKEQKRQLQNRPGQVVGGHLLAILYPRVCPGRFCN